MKLKKYTSFFETIKRDKFRCNIKSSTFALWKQQQIIIDIQCDLTSFNTFINFRSFAHSLPERI